MMEWSLPYERALFFALNGGGEPWYSEFVWLFTQTSTWYPMAFFALALLFYKKPFSQGFIALLGIALAILFADQTASGLFKPLFERYRPTHHPDFAEYVEIFHNYRGGKYGFASSHAANSMAVACFFMLLFRSHLFTVVLLLWALFTGYTRAYLGVHFPADLLVGFLIGGASGYLAYRCYTLIDRRWAKLSDRTDVVAWPAREVNAFAAIMLLNILLLVIYSIATY